MERRASELPFTRTSHGFVLKFDSGYSIDVGWSASCKAGNMHKENDRVKFLPMQAYAADSVEIVCVDPGGHSLWLQQTDWEHKPSRCAVGWVGMDDLFKVISVLRRGGGKEKVEGRLRGVVSKFKQ
jgi:hypothetical protein